MRAWPGSWEKQKLCEIVNITTLGCFLWETAGLPHPRLFYFCRPFVKSSLNLLKYCFSFLFCFFWPQGICNLKLPNQGLNCTGCTGRPSLNHWPPGTLQGSPLVCVLHLSVQGPSHGRHSVQLIKRLLSFSQQILLSPITCQAL